MRQQSSSSSASRLFEAEKTSGDHLPSGLGCAGYLQEEEEPTTSFSSTASSSTGLPLSDYEIISLHSLTLPSFTSSSSSFNSQKSGSSDDSCTKKHPHSHSHFPAASSLFCCFLGLGKGATCSSSSRGKTVCCRGGLTRAVIEANSIVIRYTAPPDEVSKVSKVSVTSSSTGKCSWSQATRSGGIINSLLSSPLTSLSCSLCGVSFRHGEKLR